MVHGRPGHLSWRPGSMFRCSGERRSTRSRRHGRDGEPWRGASGAGLSARRSGREPARGDGGEGAAAGARPS